MRAQSIRLAPQRPFGCGKSVADEVRRGYAADAKSPFFLCFQFFDLTRARSPGRRLEIATGMAPARNHRTSIVHARAKNSCTKIRSPLALVLAPSQNWNSAAIVADFRGVAAGVGARASARLLGLQRFHQLAQ
jgi:hypothetical protein